MKKLFGALAIGLVVAGIWVHSKATYSPPNGNEVEILMELAGIFPSDYGIKWRQHGTLRSTDADAIRDPALLRGALFTHNVTTAPSRSEGDVYVEAAYRFFASDREMEPHDEFFGREGQARKNDVAADRAAYGCRCEPQATDHGVTTCYGQLRYGNYEFSLLVDYNLDSCVSPTTENQRRQQFSSVLKSADRLIYLYLEPLRRKPRWL